MKRSTLQNISLVQITRANGQVEEVNMIVVHTLKKGAWTDKLSSVLCSYHKTSRTSIREIPFSFTFDVEVVIPLEIRVISFQIAFFNEKL